MLITNNAVKISAARLVIPSESAYQNALSSDPASILSELDALGLALASLTVSESVNWKTTQLLTSRLFRLEVDHPFTMSSIVLEATVQTTAPVGFQMWNLKAQSMTLTVNSMTTGVGWIHPLAAIIKCVAFRRLAETVSSTEMTTRQRLEYTTKLNDLAANEQSLKGISPFLFRLPEEYIGVYQNAIFVRRSVNIPSDGQTFTLVGAAALPGSLKSVGLDFALDRTINDVKVVYPTANLTQVTKYITEQGAAAWFDPSFSWLQVANASVFSRVLTSQVIDFLEHDYDRYAFVVGEFAEWINGNLAYDASILIDVFAGIGKVLDRLGQNALSLVTSVQHRSLLSIVRAAVATIDPLPTKEQQLAIAACIDMLRSRITIDIDVPFTYTSAEATELSILNTLAKVAYIDWPPEFKARLVLSGNGALTYAVAGNAARSVTLVFVGHSEYIDWCATAFADPDAQSAARTIWMSLLTTFEIFVTLLASESVSYSTVNGVRTANIQARFSKLYGRMIYYMCAPQDTVIVPVRRFNA